MLRQAAGLVVLDVPSVFDDTYFETVAAADQLVLVARQDVPSVQATKLLIEGLRERKLPDPTLVLNYYTPGHEMFTVAGLRTRLGVHEVHALHPDPDGVRRAANAGKLLRDCAPSSPVVRDVHHLAVGLLRRAGVPVHEDRHTVWNWVREKLGLHAVV
jgi:pilus assembly protein CpaE